MKIYVKTFTGRKVPRRKKSTLHLVNRYWKRGAAGAARGARATGGVSIVDFPPTHFVDLENNDALQRIAITYRQGHRGCRVTRGLNIEGKCTWSSCTADARRVISHKGFCAFDITTERSTCPQCSCAIEASTCGFTDCEWMYSGRKQGSAVETKSEWQVAGDEYERFLEAGNMADWEVLIITARQNPSPRPECVMCLQTMYWDEDHESLECGCRFHRDCVTFWKVRETHCPTCRVEICRPNISTEGREGTPDISVVGREIRPNVSMTDTRPKKRSRFWRLLMRLNLVCSEN